MDAILNIFSAFYTNNVRTLEEGKVIKSKEGKRNARKRREGKETERQKIEKKGRKVKRKVY